MKANSANIQALVQWPVPATHMWLQRFQGFTNFYRQFILNCSRLATPLTLLNSFFYFCLVPCFHFSAVEQPVHHHTVYFRFWVCPNQLFPGGKTKHTTWNPGPQQIFYHPHSSRQFMMEVDASDTGAGTVISKRSLED